MLNILLVFNGNEIIQNEDAFLFPNLAVGEHEILFTDVNGCFITQTIYINGPNQMEIDWIITPVSCFGESDGSVNTNKWGSYWTIRCN